MSKPQIARVILYVRDVPAVAAFLGTRAKRSRNCARHPKGLASSFLEWWRAAATFALYERFFSMRPLPGGSAKWIELTSGNGGCTIALHKASVAQKSGAAIKIVFGIADARAFKTVAEQNGLKFGGVHEADGFAFSNAKDPAGNSIQISGRGLDLNHSPTNP